MDYCSIKKWFELFCFCNVKSQGVCCQVFGYIGSFYKWFLLFFTPQEFEIFKLGFTLIFLWQILAILWEMFFLKFMNFKFFWEKTTKNSKNATKITTTAYNWNKCFKFFIFMFWIVPNLAKHNYGLWPLEHHHKIEKTKNKKQWLPYHISFNIIIISAKGANY
jgi:hypothetical protein